MITKETRRESYEAILPKITDRKSLILEIMKTLTQADLLVLDDAGAEKCTQWTEPTLYTIIDERYTNKRSIIVTTNAGLEELEQKIGFRAMDRLLEVCAIVENEGTSYRQEVGR